ncbi:Yip1 family protein [Saccharicrinis sp. 156]|uniref:Yip1 family protein n=1 Tax=Saccharicrinis sp. 156 TaxID=3417574 RepID=UPI003D337EE9
MEATKKQESLTEKYKSLFVRTKNLIVSPKQEWKAIHNETSDINIILSNYVLPYMAVLSLITFVSYIGSHQGYPFETALKRALSQFASFFFGLYISYFIVLKIIPKFTVRTYHKNLKLLAFKIAAYNSIILYLIVIATALIPQIYFLQIIGIYTAYLVWIATHGIGKFESHDLRVVFTVIVSLLLMFVPYFISVIFIETVALY